MLYDNTKGGGNIHMKKTFIALIAIIGVFAGTLLVVQGTQAFGFNRNIRSDRALDSQATALGMTTDELQTQLQTKSLSELMNEQGITLDEFKTQMEAEAKQRMKDQGLSDEEIAQRLQTMGERMNARHEMFASLMGIDASTLNAELANSSMPELLDKYNVSHVVLHDAMQQNRGQNMGPDFGHHGPGMGMGL